MYGRGAVWLADWPGVGPKFVLIVSAQAVTLKLRPIVARITSVQRGRAIDTAVPLSAGEVDGLPEDSYVICHDLFTLPGGLLAEYKGNLTPSRLLEVERGLQVALGMD
jgi:mRNA-degrading endonuclease toxin of MazEF toxin-antitoxin module